MQYTTLSRLSNPGAQSIQSFNPEKGPLVLHRKTSLSSGVLDLPASFGYYIHVIDRIELSFSLKFWTHSPLVQGVVNANFDLHQICLTQQWPAT